MPTKFLPPQPDIEHLKHQAKDLRDAHRAGVAQALQRIREFHPRFRGASDADIRAAPFTQADALLAIAREYGFPSWPRIKAFVEEPDQDIRLPQHERIRDPLFRRAVDLLDAGDAEGLRTHLRANPGLATQHVTFEGGNYFRDPSLLEFIAENPQRHGRLPPNIVEVARVILDEGGGKDPGRLGEALGLVASGQVAREAGVQVPLIDLLCDAGAEPDRAMLAALAHGEFGAVDALLRRGATLDLRVAAATGRSDEARRLLPAASAEDRHCALALAAGNGHVEIVAMLLDAGEDPDRYAPIHSHCTPMHQAVIGDHLEVVRLLVERGARRDIRDILHQGTPLDWAEHEGRREIAAYLRGLGP